MKILFYSFDSYSDIDVMSVFNDMGVYFETFKYELECEGHNKNYDEEFVDYFIKTFDTSIYDAVFSIDYWPPLALACYKKNIKYISWCYDCPFDLLNPEDTLALPNVRCFVFDRAQCKYYTDQGLDNVFYMPLGVNEERYKKIDVHKKQCDPYRTDVSFIGKLYENSFPLIANTVNEKTRLLLNNIVEMHRKIPQQDVLTQVLTDGFIDVISKEMHTNDPSFTDDVTKNKVRYALECQIARLDRITMLNMCGKRYKTAFYSGSTFELLENVNCHGYVNYWNEMPWIFAASRINLNPTLPAIHTGLNLRAYDITACGGFMLINSQLELPIFFEAGKEVAVYNSVYDFIDIVDYYLSHEDERLEIAKAGRARCLTEHTMKKRLSKIFEASM